MLQLFAEIQRAPNEAALARLVLDAAPKLMGANALGYYVLDGETDSWARGMTDREYDNYELYGRPVDALNAFVCEHHVPAQMVLADLERFPAFRAFVKRHDIDVQTRGYLAVPIVSRGVTGVVRMTTLRDPGFDADAMRVATAVGVHLSARASVLRALEGFDDEWDGALSTRERELATLAARGLSTEQMSVAAGVSPNTVKKHLKSLYAKLHVSSRAELGALLLRGPEALRRMPRRRV